MIIRPWTRRAVGVGLIEQQAFARYEYILRPAVDGHSEGFCTLVGESARRQIVGAHVLGECSAKVIQMMAAFQAQRCLGSVWRPW